jgi:hypothetical protein
VEIAEIFEAMMLTCFGMAWPFSIYKMLKSKCSDGKSLLFLFIIFLGYVFGILFQIFGEFDIVLVLYVFNALIVSLDCILVIYYRRKNFKSNFS